MVPDPQPSGWTWSEALLNWQRDHCAICGVDLKFTRRALDHSHTTGLIRGWLCSGCNTAWAEQNEAYTGGLNPAAMLGVVQVYLNPRGEPVIYSSEECVQGCLTLSGFSPESTAILIRSDSTNVAMERARDVLWAAEGWPVPKEWRWKPPARVGHTWTPPTPERIAETNRMLDETLRKLKDR